MCPQKLPGMEPRRRIGCDPQMKRIVSGALAVLAMAVFAAPGITQQSQQVQLQLQPCQLELTADWQPLTGTLYGLEKRLAVLRQPTVAVERASYDQQAFGRLLPAHAVSPGDTWRVPVRDVLPFLRQLHPGATAELHHDGGSGAGARGAFGCLVGFDERHAWVMLRVHADFLLEGDGARGRSTWFTPSQFEGWLVVDRRAGAIEHLRLAVPDATTNVDVNLAVEQGVMADIGRVAAMGVTGGEPVPLADGATAITVDAARRRLAQRFYDLVELDWQPLGEALALAQRTQRPLHVVLLFGSLLDESC